MLRSGLVSVAVVALSLTMLGCVPNPAVDWIYSATDDAVWGLTIGKTADGGFIVGGGLSWYNPYVVKLDALGVEEWAQTYSVIEPLNHTELWRHEARGALQTADGGYIVLGRGNNLGDGLLTAGFLLVKTDASGDVVWSKPYVPDNPYDPGHYCVENQPYALAITSDGGYVAFGSSYVGSYNLASILKTDADGTAEFFTVINDNARAYDQDIIGGQQTADGGYALYGYSDNGSPHGYLALLIKLDAAGNLEFSKTYQYTPDNHGAVAYAGAQTADGGYVIGGELVNDITKALTYGCWMSKVDADGEIVWSRAYGHDTTIHYPNAIRETPQGDILAGGNNNDGTMALAKFTADGTPIWNLPMPETVPAGIVNALTLMDDGSCVMAGSGVTGGPTEVIKVKNAFTGN